MKNSIRKIKFLFLSLALSAICFSLYQCNTSDTTSLNAKKDLPEKILVEGVIFAEFAANIKREFETLTTDQKNILGRYVAGEEKKNIEARKGGTSCGCSAEQSTCSASGNLSECCICCPKGRAAVCGIYFGIASCKCEDFESGGGRIETNPTTVTFYPQKFAQTLAFAKSNNMNVSAIEAHFNKLISLTVK
jgi:hypothetical protein